jgi:hypothetical protein
MYLVLFYCNLFNTDHYADTDTLSDQEIQQIRRNRVAVLNTYPLGEILELYTIVQFLGEIMEGLTGGLQYCELDAGLSSVSDCAQTSIRSISCCPLAPLARFAPGNIGVSPTYARGSSY